MKLLLTTMLLTVSSGLSAHTGDHNGVWHDHGLIAMMLTCIGFYLLSRLNRSNLLMKTKVKIKKLILFTVNEQN